MNTKDYDNPTHNPKPKLIDASRNIVQAPNHTLICDEPAYLFWKVQSRLAKLTNRLRLEKKLIIENPSQKISLNNPPSKDSD